MMSEQLDVLFCEKQWTIILDPYQIQMFIQDSSQAQVKKQNNYTFGENYKRHTGRVS